MRAGLVVYGKLETQSGGYLYDRKLVERLRARGHEVLIFSQPWAAYPSRLVRNLDMGFARRIAAAGLDILLQDELNHPSLFLLNRHLRGLDSHLPLAAIVHHLRIGERHPRVWRPFYRAIERAYLDRLDRFIFNSHATRRAVEALLKRPLQGCVATPAGDRFGVTLSAGEIRARVDSPEPRRILFVGNLIERKGLDYLLRSLSHLKSLDWRLRVAGRSDVDPRYHAVCVDLAGDLGLALRVDWLGNLRDEVLCQEMANASILAVPSQFEGFGIVYLEGMAFGLPAVGSRAGGAGEVIEDGQNGILVSPGDEGGLARGLAALLSDRERLLAASLSARARFDQFPGWAEGMDAVCVYLETGGKAPA